jgi:hypothetical protein
MCKSVEGKLKNYIDLTLPNTQQNITEIKQLPTSLYIFMRIITISCESYRRKRVA